MTILLLILFILFALILHHAAIVSLDHIDWLVMFTERHND